MTIRVVCRNGHALKVSDSSAGKSGPCPVCKVLVQIPSPAGRHVRGRDSRPPRNEAERLSLFLFSHSRFLGRRRPEEGVDGASADEGLHQVQPRDGHGGAASAPIVELMSAGRASGGKCSGLALFPLVWQASNPSSSFAPVHEVVLPSALFSDGQRASGPPSPSRIVAATHCPTRLCEHTQGSLGVRA